MKLKRNKFILLFFVFSLLVLSVNLYAILDNEGKVVSVDIEEIKVIRRVVKRSEVWKGIQIGGFIGAVAGALLFIASEKDKVGFLPIAMFASPTIIVGVAIGASIGGMVSVAVADKTIHLEGMTDSETRKAMGKLRKKARIRDYK